MFYVSLGPHSSYTTSFIGSSIYMSLKLNAAVLLVNYRGSTGYGQRSIDSLCGMYFSIFIYVCDTHISFIFMCIIMVCINIYILYV